MSEFDDILAHYHGRRILVTGASGYLATNLIAALLNVPCEIVRCTRSSTLPAITGVAQVDDRQGSLANESFCRQLVERIDVIFHLAAQTSVSVAERDPVADWQANVLPMIRLLQACKSTSTRPCMIFTGTVTQAGLPTCLPVNESHPDEPITVYDLHKLIAERYLRLNVRQGHLHGITLRLPNVLGPGPRSSAADRGVLNQMIARAIQSQPLTIYGKGNQLRDYVFVTDVIEALLRAGMMDGAGQHYLLGSGEGHTIAQAIHLVAQRVQLRTGQPVHVEHVQPGTVQSAIDNRDFLGDFGVFYRDTGWRPRHSLVDAIDATLDTLGL